MPHILAGNFFLKILDRKNMELEEVKSHYRNKITEMEGATKKQERKGTGVVRCFLFMSAKSLKELRLFL